MKSCPYGCIDRICAQRPDGEPCPLGYMPEDDPLGEMLALFLEWWRRKWD